MINLRWRVGEVPTGPYRAFAHRSWPAAYYRDGRLAGFLGCDDSYEPRDVAAARHGPITIYVTDYSKDLLRPTNRRLVRPATTLDEAKSRLVNALNNKLNYMVPPGYRKEKT